MPNQYTKKKEREAAKEKRMAHKVVILDANGRLEYSTDFMEVGVSRTTPNKDHSPVTAIEDVGSGIRVTFENGEEMELRNAPLAVCWSSS